MLAADEALGGLSGDTTWRVAHSIVDHALDWGWDRTHGGLWLAGQAFGPPLDRAKSWWVQAEGLVATLVMHERYLADTDRYWGTFRKQLEFIFCHLIDHRYGGWYARVSEDGSRVIGGSEKAGPWKTAYHDGRALFRTVSTLRRLGTAVLP